MIRQRTAPFHFGQARKEIVSAHRHCRAAPRTAECVGYSSGSGAGGGGAPGLVASQNIGFSGAAGPVPSRQNPGPRSGERPVLKHTPTFPPGCRRTSPRACHHGTAGILWPDSRFGSSVQACPRLEQLARRDMCCPPSGRRPVACVLEKNRIQALGLGDCRHSSHRPRETPRLRPSCVPGLNLIYRDPV